MWAMSMIFGKSSFLYNQDKKKGNVQIFKALGGILISNSICLTNTWRHDIKDVAGTRITSHVKSLKWLISLNKVSNFNVYYRKGKFHIHINGGKVK